MNKIRNAYNYKSTRQPSPELGNSLSLEQSPYPSLTVPNQNKSIREMVERQRRGQEITVLTGLYQEDGNYNELMAKVDRMSEMERLDYARSLAEETKAGLAKYREDMAAREKQIVKDREAALQAKIKASEDALHLLRNPVVEEPK